MKKLLVIIGPTATGKTDLALQLAKQFNGELVACDSRQVYRGLDIGTGKEPAHSVILNDSEGSQDLKNKSRDSSQARNDILKSNGYWVINEIKIWMYDVVNLASQYTVADYVKDASKVIDEITKRGKLPIIVGGTGLYLKALLEGLPNLSIPLDEDLRKDLEKLSVGELQEKLRSLSPSRLAELNNSDRSNPRRLIRQIELLSMNPYVLRVQNADLPAGKAGFRMQNFDVLKIGLSAPREVLYKRSDLRVLDWFGGGIVEEVRKLRSEGVNLDRFKSLGLEYGAIAEFLESDQTNEIELVESIKNKLHGYIRRQLTWFKKEKDTQWFDITRKNYLVRIANAVRTWYY